MTKISSFTALAGAGVDTAADLVPIVDMSEAGAARNKKITIAELKIALGVPTAYTDEMARDAIGAALAAGTNITITNDDAGDTITIDAAAGGGLDAEAVMDLIADMLTAGSNVTLTYDDASDTLTVASSGGGAGTLAGLTDVDLTGAATGDVLTKDAGGDWVPSGGTAWQLVNQSGVPITSGATWTYSSAVANVDVTGLGSYRDLMVVARGISSTSSGNRGIVLSVGGVFYTASGDYVSISDAGVEANGAAILTHDTASTAARSLSGVILGIDVPGPKLGYGQGTGSNRQRIFVAATGQVDGLRLIPGGGGNITAGSLYIYAR